MTIIERKCPNCNKLYQANTDRIKHGRQLTCCKKCAFELKKKTGTKGKFYICPVCSTEFYRANSTIKECQAIYCSSGCAYKGRSLGLTKRVITKPYDIKVSLKNRIFVDCQNCGKPIETIPSLKNRKRFCSKECFNQSLVESMQGENNPSWVDGRSRHKRCYRGDDWESQRLSAYIRDNYTCQSCGVKCVSRKAMNESNASQLIQCHHVIMWKDNPDNSLENLITLCASCHKKIHEGKINLEH